MEFTWDGDDSYNNIIFNYPYNHNMVWDEECSTGSTYECASIKCMYNQKAGDTVDIDFWSTNKISAVSIGSESTPFCVTSS